MKTNNRKLGASLIGLIFASLVVFAGYDTAGTAHAGYSQNFTPRQVNDNDVILKPGWVTSCQNNFVLENLGEKPAEVQIDLGFEKLSKDEIDVWGKRSYNLRQSLAFAKQLGKTVTMDDVALVRNYSESSDIRVHC